MSPSIHLYVLASGSKGNAAIIQGPAGSILLDDGISTRMLKKRCTEAGIDPLSIQAVLITHEHADHVSGLSVFCTHYEGPLYATAGTVGGRRYLSELPFTLIDHSETFELCGMRITAFPTSHDVADPVGFRFSVLSPRGEETDALGWCTDTGYLTSEALDNLSGCRILGIESNHDCELLEQGPYPRNLKNRVSGITGHLSNEQSAAALPHLVSSATECVVALHLSEENNRPSLCIKTLAQAVGAQAIDTTSPHAQARTPDGLLSIVAASQREVLSVF